ncbi:hypothetical protein [Duganella sp. CF458]|uniref:hypothetical protein n=1 Tax=Duganella sp. CF458 TaxID=1884368 RepID=UPI000B872252|nr:hypothetical protein [Duganella sp. CF458]
MFNPDLISALTVLSKTRTEEGYVERQEALLQHLPGEYDQLVDIAYDVEDSSIRIEALELVALAAKDDSRTVLSDSMKADPDPVVQKHSEGLLFRAIVNENIRKHLLGAAH